MATLKPATVTPPRASASTSALPPTFRVRGNDSGIYRRAGFRSGAVRYELIELLACGGMASVFLAAQFHGGHGANLDRIVAVKTPHPRLDPLDRNDDGGCSADAQDRALLREARIGASVRSPNVVQTMDFVDDGERALLVLEWAEGVSLADLLPSRACRSGGHDHAVPAAIAAGVVRSLLAGLDAVHATRGADGRLVGLVHRDITPGNVLLGVDGRARISDFGLARTAADEAHAFDRTRIEGTARYLAPEQARGERLDGRVDIFAAGILLFELLTGTALYGGASANEIVEAAARGAELAARVLDDHAVPSGIAAVCLKALAFHRDARFATARDFAHALDRASRTTVGIASHDTVARYVDARFVKRLERQRQRIAEWRSVNAGATANRTRVSAA